MRRTLPLAVYDQAWANLRKFDWSAAGGPQRSKYEKHLVFRQRQVKITKSVAEERLLRRCRKVKVVERRSIQGAEHYYIGNAEAKDGSFTLALCIPAYAAGNRITEEDVVQALANAEAGVMAATRPGHFLDRSRGTKRGYDDMTRCGTVLGDGRTQSGQPAKRHQPA